MTILRTNFFSGFIALNKAELRSKIARARGADSTKPRILTMVIPATKTQEFILLYVMEVAILRIAATCNVCKFLSRIWPKAKRTNRTSGSCNYYTCDSI